MFYSDLCPVCGVLRGMDVTGYRMTVVNDRGETKSLLTRAYHCQMCMNFVRSEEVEDTDVNLEGVLLDDEMSLEKL